MDRYGAAPPPPPPPPAASHHVAGDYGRSRRRSPSPRRYNSPPPSHSRGYSGGSRYRSRSPPRYRSRSPPRRYAEHRPRPAAPVYRGTEEDRAKSTTLFVGNIPYGFVEQDVVGLFERFGRLRLVYVPIDRITRRNKGFAFVEFEQRLDAEDAYFKYNGYTIEGRKLRLDWDVGADRKEHLKPTAVAAPPPVRDADYDDRRRDRYDSPPRRNDRYDSPPPRRPEPRNDTW